MEYPLKINWKSEIVPVLAMIAAVLTAIITYPLLPEKVAVHYNFAGEPDSWAPKIYHAILFPAIMIGMYFLFFIFTAIDPRKERYEDFKKVYHFFRTAMVVIFFGIYLATTLANLGYNISIAKTVSLLVGILIVAIGNYMAKIKRNWFFGIKTPWTLSSENVWNKTHRLGGWVFILFGLIIIIDPYLPMVPGSILFFAGVIIAVLLPMVYSYYLYKKENEKK